VKNIPLLLPATISHCLAGQAPGSARPEPPSIGG
jgi:hypothetical protein